MAQRRDAVTITRDIWWVGALNPDLRVFDVIMRTENGTSYNAYIVKGEKATALIEAVKSGFEDELIERLAGIADLADIDYIVCNHTEPDHSSGLITLLEKCTKATIVSSKPGSMIIRALVGRDYPAMIVKSGDSIDLGGLTLQFIDAPFLHWPDSIFTYVPERKTLFTCDVFGFHHTVPDVFADLTNEDLQASKKYYFDVIFGPFKKYVLDAVAKIRPLSIDCICPSHGPVYRQNAWDVVDEYECWAQPKPPRARKQVLIAYVSCYGMTRLLAEALATGVADAGLDAKVIDVSQHRDDAADALAESDAVLVGSPTLNRDALPPIWAFLSEISAISQRDMLAGAFGSFGWSGEAVKMIEDRLKSLGLKVRELDCRVKIKPHDAELRKARDAGKAFAESL